MISLQVQRQFRVGDRVWSAACTTYLRRGPRKTGWVMRIADDVEISIWSADVAERFEDAVRIARGFLGQPASIDGVPLRGWYLSHADVGFFYEGSEGDGRLEFRGHLEAALPAIVDVENAELIAALERAHRLGSPITEIQVTDHYFIFGMPGIGVLGAFVDRRDGSAHAMGSSLSIELWLWGYERGLLHEPPADLVIDRVNDPLRATKLRRLARFGSEKLENVPLLLEGCASWLAIDTLHELGDAIEWHVQSTR